MKYQRNVFDLDLDFKRSVLIFRGNYYIILQHAVF